MDKGGGGKNAYPQNVDKKHVFFFEPFPYLDCITLINEIGFLETIFFFTFSFEHFLLSTFFQGVYYQLNQQTRNPFYTTVVLRNYAKIQNTKIHTVSKWDNRHITQMWKLKTSQSENTTPF